MIKDIYSRDIDAANYDPLRLEVNDSLSCLILKIENMLFTRKGEVLGDAQFGANLDELVFTLVLNEASIQRRIESQIAAYCLNVIGNYTVNTQVQFFSTPERDGALIDIYINQNRVIGMLF